MDINQPPPKRNAVVIVVKSSRDFIKHAGSMLCHQFLEGVARKLIDGTTPALSCRGR
jgi:hypothetical protein